EGNLFRHIASCQHSQKIHQGAFMFFKDRKWYVLNFSLILVLLSGLFGIVPTNQVWAAAQGKGSSSNIRPDSDTCDLDTGWVWTNGPVRPEIAQQAELALKK